MMSYIPLRREGDDFVLEYRPKTRVELHVHLDGCIRHETIWEIAKNKNATLPGKGTLRELSNFLVIREPINLEHFLSPFGFYMPLFEYDFKAIERISYEMCEDKSRSGVAYFEARVCPHLFVPSHPSASKDGNNQENLEEVIRSVNKGFTAGEREFGIKARMILCCITGHPQWSHDILYLAEKFRDEGVVGIDIAGKIPDDVDFPKEELQKTLEELHVFEEAKKLGIRRTVHAGESGPASMIKMALEHYHAERIGHGYTVLQDKPFYEQCLSQNIHFECCPWSSYLTGAISLGTRKHPIVRFAEDSANFSISTDDPTETGKSLDDDYNLVMAWGLTEAHLIKSNLMAAKASFLPRDERASLIKQLKTPFTLEDF